MGLKLTVSRGDKIITSNGIVIDVRTNSDKQVVLEFHAPIEIKIHAIFKDSSKQFKNLQNVKAGLPQSVGGDIDEEPGIEPGQLMSPAEQRAAALRGMNRRNGR